MPKTWIVLVSCLALVPLLYALSAPLSHPPFVPASARALEPILSPLGGYYSGDVQVEISFPYSVGEILSTPYQNRGSGQVLFTLDGSVPTHATGTVYNGPIHLSAGVPAVTVVRARAVLPGGELGPVTSASYLVGLSATLPVLSLIVDPGDLWSAERGIYANPLERGRGWERPVDVTYVDIAHADAGHRSEFHVPAGLRIHGGATRSADKKSFRLYFRGEYGLSRLEYPLFAQGEVQSFKRLVLHHGGQDSIGSQANWLLLRNQLIGDLALELGGCAARSRPVLVFLNGQSWGVYQIREYIDRWFLADHYGIESVDLLDTPVINGLEAAIEGDREHWDQLIRFVETHNLADQANYAYVRTQVDAANLIDYTILQVYSANVDWLHTNVNQFRPRVPGGRWRWFFWDSDWSFGLEPHSEVGSNIIRDALNPSHPDTAGADTLLLRKLLENPHFRNWFLTRAADLLNTVLSPEAVIARIDALAAEIGPDIAYETSRWPRSADHWQASVQALRDFARARPDVVRRHLVQAFDLDGTVSLTFDAPSAGEGSVAVNGALLPELPWQGVYFHGTEVQVTAVPMPGYRFAGWDAADLVLSAPKSAPTRNGSADGRSVSALPRSVGPATPAWGVEGPVLTTTLSTTGTVTCRFVPVGREAFRPGDVVFGGRGTDEESGGVWFELLVRRHGGVDLRGWRVTDNDSKWASDEGTLVFREHPALARVPHGTTVRIVWIVGTHGGAPADDVDGRDRRMVLYVGNGNLDEGRDPGFSLGPNDNLALLAPGATVALKDDQGIAFVAGNTAVTPASFGVLADGVVD